jgi:hypothetical protein
MKTIIAAAMAILMTAAPAWAAKPQRAIVLTGKAMTDVLKQCSRTAPIRGEGWFKPTPAQINMLDRQTATRLDERNSPPKKGMSLI